jgi:hypothetical protein
LYPERMTALNFFPNMSKILAALIPARRRLKTAFHFDLHVGLGSRRRSLLEPILL